LDLGCGDGLFSHLIARRGIPVLGLEPERGAVDLARRLTSDQDYPRETPRFMEAEGGSIPVEAGQVSGVAMFDVIEHLSNPVGVLRECARVLAPGGHLIVTTPAWELGRWSDPDYHVCEYTEAELVDQIQAATALQVVTTGRVGGIYRDVIVVARRDK
ncbi:MAG: class I SAM-dependent methyltransferase, partial [Planctomycetota bacterium]